MINIIIPVYNRPKHTFQTIDSLYQNTTDFELTVVNDNSDKETSKLLKDLSRKHGFKLIVNKVNIGPGRSRNIACERVDRKDYLYFSDNDVYFKPGWLPQLIHIYEVVSKDRIGLLGASCHPYLQPYNTFKVNDDYEVYIRDAISGYSHLTTWELWDRFGPFDHQDGLEKKTGRSDDWAFCQRMRAGGFEVGSVMPELIIPTGLTDSYGDKAIGKETFTNYADIFIE